VASPSLGVITAATGFPAWSTAYVLRMYCGESAAVQKGKAKLKANTVNKLNNASFLSVFTKLLSTPLDWLNGIRFSTICDVVCHRKLHNRTYLPQCVLPLPTYRFWVPSGYPLLDREGPDAAVNWVGLRLACCRRGKCGGPEKRRRKRELFSAAITVNIV
jgi:hypothetical protein